MPSREQGFVTHDVHRQPGSVPQSDRKLPELPLGAEREVQASGHEACDCRACMSFRRVAGIGNSAGEIGPQRGLRSESDRCLVFRSFSGYISPWSRPRGSAKHVERTDVVVTELKRNRRDS